MEVASDLIKVETEVVTRAEVYEQNTLMHELAANVAKESEVEQASYEFAANYAGHCAVHTTVGMPVDDEQDRV